MQFESAGWEEFVPGETTRSRLVAFLGLFSLAKLATGQRGRAALERGDVAASQAIYDQNLARPGEDAVSTAVRAHLPAAEFVRRLVRAEELIALGQHGGEAAVSDEIRRHARRVFAYIGVIVDTMQETSNGGMDESGRFLLNLQDTFIIGGSVWMADETDMSEGSMPDRERMERLVPVAEQVEAMVHGAFAAASIERHMEDPPQPGPAGSRS